MGQALSAAMKPEMNAPGGCNAGFLRDDALLMVTFIGGYDYDSKGNPDLWADRVLSAKGGDQGAVVMVSILDPKCPRMIESASWSKNSRTTWSRTATSAT
ncbi:MAG: hypothetical protein IPK80_27075 [Nannocystis sp.]|nr:hypothetical protein [Nannocystis sp.]